MSPTPSLGAGPPVLAFDVGGTSIKGALIDAAGTAHGVTRLPTPAAGPTSAQAVLDAVARLAPSLTAQAPEGVAPTALGIAVPGVFDDEAGVGVYCENLGWRDVDFRRLVRAGFDLPTVVGHDVRSAGLAEMAVGAGAGAQNALVLALGTGIAAAVFVRGEPVTSGGFAGEIGHTVVVRGGEACACGNQGCLEATASAAAIARRYNRARGARVSGSREVLAAARAGDAVARAVWASATDALASAIAPCVGLLAPEVVVLAGGLAEAGDALLAPVVARLDELLTVTPAPPVVKATAGENAGLLGAALRARAVAEAGSR
ncbi:ROK family protein [Xylanimonas ulmi]|uniref:Glucokinase n=1 Tax=Xylanimonas ulmi TaxID=228973 RepID=A0A4Q7LXQ3_9MICO|nr:ROK family protein [Xylanibacterium ulmi]RZS59835.1 glucokinase [Xylanibacterium ulmi]